MFDGIIFAVMADSGPMIEIHRSLLDETSAMKLSISLLTAIGLGENRDQINQLHGFFPVPETNELALAYPFTLEGGESQDPRTQSSGRYCMIILLFDREDESRVFANCGNIEEILFRSLRLIDNQKQFSIRFLSNIWSQLNYDTMSSFPEDRRFLPLRAVGLPKKIMIKILEETEGDPIFKKALEVEFMGMPSGTIITTDPPKLDFEGYKDFDERVHIFKKRLAILLKPEYWKPQNNNNSIMDSHTSNHRGFCPFRIQKQDSKAGCVLKLGYVNLCYTQELRPLLFKDGRYFCPKFQFELSTEIYNEIESFVNSILTIQDEETTATNLWTMLSGLADQSKILNQINVKIPAKISVLGLDSAGKTTLLQRLKTGRWIPDTTPTIGMNAEMIQIGDVTFSGWALGGQLQFRRALWEMYTKNSAGLIYVVDVSDPARFPEARNNLWRMLKMDHLKDIPIAIFANQEDINEDGQAITEEELAKTLGINQKIDQSIKIFYTNTKTGIGIQEGVDWLINIIQKRPKSPGN